MKTHKLLVSIFALALTGFVFTSCEKDNEQETTTELFGEDLDEIKALEEIKVNSTHADIQSKSAISYTKVNRYYKGGAFSVHTYQTINPRGGAGFGTYEGVAFNTPFTSSHSAVDRNEYNFLFFLVHPKYHDFVMTTSTTEYWNLRGQGWRNITGNYVLIHKRQKSGLKRLYRFYGSNSDHLFTTNFSEGSRAGYTYEGVVGWVK